MTTEIPRRFDRIVLLVAAFVLLPTLSGCGGSHRAWADLDGGGIHDADDPDIDGDGFLNAKDAFPRTPCEFYDSDGNGTGNYAQADEDGDTEDAFPLDAALSEAYVFEESEFNDNLAAANSIAKQLQGVRKVPKDLPPRVRVR